MQSPVLANLRCYISEKKVEVPLSLLIDVELEEMRVHLNFEKEIFCEEVKRLIEEGEKVKIGTFHSHEVEGRCLSEADKKVVSLGEKFEPGFGANSSIHVLISGTLIVYEYESVEELGRITLLGYDWNEIDELLED